MNRLSATAPLKKTVKLTELLGLVVILLATLYAAGSDLLEMIRARQITLPDLLLLFLYLEVLAMVGVYMESGKLPIRFPLYIGIIALARYLTLDVKNMETWHIIAIGVTIVLLAVSVLLIRFGHLRLPYPEGEANKKAD